MLSRVCANLRVEWGQEQPPDGIDGGGPTTSTPEDSSRVPIHKHQEAGEEVASAQIIDWVPSLVLVEPEEGPFVP
jgi:hypothetical protein